MKVACTILSAHITHRKTFLMEKNIVNMEENYRKRLLRIIERKQKYLTFSDSA